MSAETPPVDRRFPKSERLLRRPDFVRVQTQGSKFGTGRLTIVWLPSEAEGTRVGITVSRKVGCSPERARVKRWIREIYRQHKEAWPASTDFVVIARPGAAAAGYWKLREDMLRWAGRVRPREAR